MKSLAWSCALRVQDSECTPPILHPPPPRLASLSFRINMNNNQLLLLLLLQPPDTELILPLHLTLVNKLLLLPRLRRAGMAGKGLDCRWPLVRMPDTEKRWCVCLGELWVPVTAVLCRSDPCQNPVALDSPRLRARCFSLSRSGSAGRREANDTADRL